MRISKFKTHLCLGAALLAAPAAIGQEAESEDEEMMMDRQIVVGSPIRDSQAAALELKRESDNVVDIITADTIGRFPDQNLADSLGRVSGLAIERDQGQARFINFRGAPFRFTAIAFDGIDVPGAENGRIPRFDSFPSVITSTVEVNKAITPDMPGEAVAGFINIETFKPFDQEGFRFSGEAGYGNQDLGEVPINKYNLRASYSTDQVGLLIFGSHNLRGRITDNREYDLEEDPVTGGIIPRNLDFRSYRGEREDNAYGATFEFRPTPDSRIYARSLFSEFIDREERNQYDFDIADGDTSALVGVTSTLLGDPVTPDTGFAPLVLVQRLLEDGRYRNSTWVNTIGAEFALGDWDVSASANYIETDNSTFLPLPLSAGGMAALQYDVTDIQDPQVTLFQPFTTDVPLDINTLEYAADLGLVFFDLLDTENLKFKVDAERDMTLFSRPTTVKTGVQLDFREAEGGSALSFGGIPVNPSDFITAVPWSTDFSNTIGANNYDNPGLLEAWIEGAGGNITPEFDADSLIAIDENIYAAFAMATTDFSWGNIVFGARLEVTDFTSSGSALIDGVQNPISVDNTYVNVLPSLHVNFDLTEDLKLRLSGTTGVSRPTYVETRATVSVDPTETPVEASGGNPNLEAEYAWGGDVALEWYFAEASILSIGGFARFIDDVIYADTTIIDDGSALAPGFIDPGTPTTFNSFFNGEDGELFGLEASFIGQATFLPEPFDGFGASANITLLDSEFTAPTQGGAVFPLPGTSDLVFNASVFFERYGLSARINYQFRDDWLSTTENDSLTEFWEATERLDASIRYTVPVDFGGATVTLFVDGNNLTNETDLRYVNSARTPNQLEGFGERYVGGIRLDF